MDYAGLADLTFYRGRVALAAILKGLGIGNGDEVATQAFTCLAVPEGIMAAGARPLYIDIEPSGYTMDPGDLETKIGPRTRAIVLQHTFGIPAQMTPIMQVAQKAGIPVIEDCCHTLASTYEGRLLGAFGIAAFYSFEWGKPVVVGLGGSVRINDAELLRQLENDYSRYVAPGIVKRLKLELQYRAFGLLYWPRLYWPVRWAFHTLSRLGAAEGNYNPIPADGQLAEDFALRMPRRLRSRLLRKITHIDEHTRHNRWLAEGYAAQIGSAAVKHPKPPAESETVYARYPLRAADKPRLLAAARAHNVELAEWYATPVHPLPLDQSAQVGYQRGSCPHAETRAGEVVSLPIHGRVGPRYLRRAAEFLNKQ